MLTSDLVRGTTRKGDLHLKWVDPTNAEARMLATLLLDAFREHEGHQAAELDEAIADIAAGARDALLVRGLAKLLWDLTPVEARSRLEATVIREAVFGLAAEHWPVRAVASDGSEGSGTHAPGAVVDGFHDRAEVVAAAALALGLTPTEVEDGLYADRPGEQWVGTLPVASPDDVLCTYNLALAQAALLKASVVEVELPELEPKRARALLRELKFRRLLAAVRADEGVYRLTLDGPLSLFKQTSRYGVQLAQFLPALARCPRWRLRATVRWGRGKGRDVLLTLDQSAPIVLSTQRQAAWHDRATWQSAEEDVFIASFAELDTRWKLVPEATLIDLGGDDVWVPDYRLEHPDGRVAHLEIVWAWRRQTFEARLGRLAKAGPRGIVIAWAERGRADEGKGAPTLPTASTAAGAAAKGRARASDGPAMALVGFKGVIVAQRILAAAEEVARAPARASGARSKRS